MVIHVFLGDLPWNSFCVKYLLASEKKSGVRYFLLSLLLLLVTQTSNPLTLHNVATAINQPILL